MLSDCFDWFGFAQILEFLKIGEQIPGHCIYYQWPLGFHSFVSSSVCFPFFSYSALRPNFPFNDDNSINVYKYVKAPKH